MKPQTHSYEDKLLEFAYGELPPDEARSLESHLKGCTKCSEALDAIRGVRRAMAQLPSETPPDDGLESLLAYAEQAARRSALGPEPKNTWWRRWMVPAFGAASLVVVGVIGLRVTQHSEAPTAVEGVKVEKTIAQPSSTLDDQGVEGGGGPSGALAAAEKTRGESVSERSKPKAKKMRREEMERAPVAAAPPAPAPAEAPKDAESAAEEQDAVIDTRYAQNTINDAPTAQRPYPSKGAPLKYTRKADAPAAQPQAKSVVSGDRDQASSGMGLGGVSTSYRQRGATPVAPPATEEEKKVALKAEREAFKEDSVVAGRSSVASYSAQAQAARGRGDRASEISLLRSAIASGASGGTLQNLLSRLCDAQLAVGGGTDACTSLMAQFPESSAAQLAQKRMKAVPTESPAKPAQAAPSSAPTH